MAKEPLEEKGERVAVLAVQCQKLTLHEFSQLETEKRGFYAGMVGYIEPDGSLDTCITIRSALKKDDILILQAGAGIVYDSIPEREYEETSNKLGAMGKILGVEV